MKIPTQRITDFNCHNVTFKTVHNQLTCRLLMPRRKVIPVYHATFILFFYVCTLLHPLNHILMIHILWLSQTNLTNPTMHLFHILQCTIRNRNMHISVLNVALWDMEQLLCGICELGQMTHVYCSDVKWASMYLKSPTTQLFFSRLVGHFEWRHLVNQCEPNNLRRKRVSL